VDQVIGELCKRAKTVMLSQPQPSSFILLMTLIPSTSRFRVARATFPDNTGSAATCIYVLVLICAFATKSRITVFPTKNINSVVQATSVFFTFLFVGRFGRIRSCGRRYGGPNFLPYQPLESTILVQLLDSSFVGRKITQSCSSIFDEDLWYD
jgi:hypothetical protein